MKSPHPQPLARWKSANRRGERGVSGRALSRWIAHHELWLLTAVAPLLILPVGFWPFLAVTVIGLTWLCRWQSSGRLTRPTGLDFPLVILAGLLGLSQVISANRALGQAAIWHLVLGLAVFYGLANALRTERDISRAVMIVGGLTLALAALSLIGTDWRAVRLVNLPRLYDPLPALVRGLPGNDSPRASDLFNPRRIGAVMGTVLPLFIALLLSSTPDSGRPSSRIRLSVPYPLTDHPSKVLTSWLLALVVLAGSAILLLSQSPQAMIGVLAAVLLLAIRRKQWVALVLPLGAALGLAGLLAVGPQRVANYLLSPENPVGLAIALRLDMWSRALAMIRDMPYTGIGLNTFPTIQTYFYPGFLIGPEPHAHNLLLQIALDAGLPGLIACLWVGITWGRRLWSGTTGDEQEKIRIVSVGLVACLLSYAVHGLFDAYTPWDRPGVMLWILLGIGAAIDNNATPSRIHRPLTLPILLLGLLILSLALSPASLYSNLGAIQAHSTLLQEQSPGIAHTSLLQAKNNLLTALVSDPGNAQTYHLLGQIDGVLGETAQAITAYRQEVRLDVQAPFARYYPSESLARQIRGIRGIRAGRPWEDVLRVYAQWSARFPQRAEPYLLAGIVLEEYEHQPRAAMEVLRQGLQQQARPTEVLSVYLQDVSSAMAASSR